MNDYGRRFALIKHRHDIVTADQLLSLKDGITAPAATAGYAQIYIDSASGSLKIIFGNGTIKTLATNP